MKRLIINGFITNEWAKRLVAHGQTLEVMGGLSGVPKSCEIHLESSEEYSQPISIQTSYTGDDPNNPGLDFINERTGR